jgi:hypothetical protein
MGRIGKSGSSRTDWFDDKKEARKASEELLENKFQRGFVMRLVRPIQLEWLVNGIKPCILAPNSI